MRPIRIVPVNGADARLLTPVAAALARELRTQCTISTRALEPAFAYHPERNQYHSTAILEHLAHTTTRDDTLVAITALDLYIPILTFVFGEAQLGGTCAVVSYHRLTQEFYGLPPDPELLQRRLITESLHEAAHTLGLTHCDDYECAMSPTHAIEWLDLKTPRLCAACRAAAGL